MRKVGLCLVLFLMFAGCTPSPEKVRKQCLENADNQIFYGEQTAAYCECLYQKLKPISDTAKLTKEVIDSVQSECDAEYTTMDTNF